MSETLQEPSLPDEVKILIEAPPVPFNQLKPYDVDDQQALYELNRRQGEAGNYDVVTLMKKVGGEVVILTRVEDKPSGAKLFEANTPGDKALDNLYHIFPGAPQEEIVQLFPRAS